jgi:transposase
MTVIKTARLNGIDPQACLADILDRIHDHKINRLDKFLPWNRAPATAGNSQAA